MSPLRVGTITAQTPFSENGDPSAIGHFSWIPNEILHIANMTPDTKYVVKPMLSGYQTFVIFRIVVEQVIADYVFPLPSLLNAASASTSKNAEVDDVAWTERLLNTLRYLDDTAIIAVLSMSGIKSRLVDGSIEHGFICTEHSLIAARRRMNTSCWLAHRTMQVERHNFGLQVTNTN